MKAPGEVCGCGSVIPQALAPVPDFVQDIADDDILSSPAGSLWPHVTGSLVLNDAARGAWPSAQGREGGLERSQLPTHGNDLLGRLLGRPVGPLLT